MTFKHDLENNVASITGHRPSELTVRGLAAYPKPHQPDGGYAYSRLVTLFVKAFQLTKPSTVISGMALGADQAAATAAIMLGIPVIAALPMLGQENRWPVSSKNLYYNLLRQFAETVVVSEGAYTAHKMNIRNEWMVDNSDYTIALYNTHKTQGGTFNCISYVEAQNKFYLNLWPSWELHKEDRFEFSNMELATVEYDGITYPSVENFYQAMKTTDNAERRQLSRLSPFDSKKAKKTLRKDWNDIKVDVMRYGLQKKFSQEPFRRRLEQSKPRTLIEWNWWRDTFWGIDINSGVGENMLGKLIMEIRE